MFEHSYYDYFFIKYYVFKSTGLEGQKPNIPIILYFKLALLYSRLLVYAQFSPLKKYIYLIHPNILTEHELNNEKM